MDKKYYLNNISEESIQISLTKLRTVKPKSSLSLNVKDVAIVKKLKAARKGKASTLDNLVLSTIKIEDDCRYSNETKAQSKQKKNDDKKKEDEAKKALEAQVKAQEEQKALEERQAVAELLKEEAAKAGKTYDEESLEKAIDVYLESTKV